MALWRIYLDPDRPEWSLIDNSFEFCIDRRIVGIGWGLEEAGPLSIEDYELLADRHYAGAEHMGWKKAFNAFASMQPGDFCWTHRPQAHEYYLARIIGDWTYRWERPYTDAGIAQSRDCRWVHGSDMRPVGYPQPEGGTITRIHDEEAEVEAFRAWIRESA